MHREGPRAVAQLGQAIESIGFDGLAVFDHVVMAYPTATRPVDLPPRMPILESLVTLGFAVAVTERVTQTTEVLLLPQRQPVLVAKQVSTVDACRTAVSGSAWESGGSARSMKRLRGLHRWWTAVRGVDRCLSAHAGQSIPSGDAAPGSQSTRWRWIRSRSAVGFPIWIGGSSASALRRVGEIGDGWMALVDSVEDARARPAR